ncbi:hypothetical protein D9M72_443070 [compost metagenome]
MEGNGIRVETDARRDAPGACPVVESRDQHDDAHAAFLVVVGGLQQHRALARVHRRIAEIEFGHLHRVRFPSPG